MNQPADNAADADAEVLIRVDSRDRAIGTADRADCHRGDGLLHRAFSIFVFNAAGEMLLQRRGARKLLWPGHWSNACCSHPRVGEDAAAAARQRLRQELGVEADLEFLYKFAYQARYR
ncbi:MAG: isopentenyl-diphosphate delta-isomerase, partial [bacterium]